MHRVYSALKALEKHEFYPAYTPTIQVKARYYNFLVDHKISEQGRESLVFSIQAHSLFSRDPIEKLRKEFDNRSLKPLDKSGTSHVTLEFEVPLSKIKDIRLLKLAEEYGDLQTEVPAIANQLSSREGMAARFKSRTAFNEKVHKLILGD